MILFGFQHCGKSTWGKKFAKQLKLPFLDTDLLIEEEIGYSYRTFWREDPERYRIVERAVVHKLPKNAVIALGGGTILDAHNRHYLEQLAPLHYLKISKERLKERYADPLFFEEIYAKRLPLYEAISAKIIDMDRSEEEILWQATH